MVGPWACLCSARELAFGSTFKMPVPIILWRIDPLLSCDCKQRLFLGNGLVNTFHGNEYARNNRVTVGNEVFLRGPCRDFIRKGQSQLSGSSVQDAVKERVSCVSAQVKVRL
jgi:hypothetical protein